jgi:3-methyl-2-oxobutanoate hydroxymethyltransferase
MSAAPPPAFRPITVPEFRAARSRHEKLAVITAYDYTSARLADAAGVDAVLVGDSLGMVVQGHSTSLPVTLRDIIYHTRCVIRGVKRALVVADLPFLTYQVSPRQAIRNAGRLMKEAGAHAVKLEGGIRMAETIRVLVAAGIPVMGHVGLTPQSVHQFGGFKVQRDETQLVADIRAVEAAGAFAVVIESVPAELGGRLTQAVTIPTIGIGAGVGCDGQVLVFHDMMGLFTDFKPKFVKRYAELGGQVVSAVETYCREVRDGTFPGPEHSFR